MRFMRFKQVYLKINENLPVSMY